MLVLVDQGLGAEASHLQRRLAPVFAPDLAVQVSPDPAPDAALLEALELADGVVVHGEVAPVWLAGRVCKRAWYTGDVGALASRLAELTGVAARSVGPRRARLAPLAREALAAALATLADRWHIDLVPNPRARLGLELCLSARFVCSDHLGAADLARAIADLAEAQDHHPTLTQAHAGLTVRVSTGEAAGRLTERDVVFARAVDGLVVARDDVGPQ